DADTRKALKQSKKTNRRQPVTKDPSEGTGISPGVPNEFTVVLTTSRSKQESGYTEEEDDDETIEWVDIDEEEEKKDDNNYKSIDLEQTNNEETDDEFMHVNKDKDEEMTNDEVEEYENGDEEITYTAKVDARKTKEVKDDAKKAKLPPTSSSLLISLGFGDQFLKLLSDTSLIGTIKDTTDAEINSLLDNKIQYEVPHIQYPLILIVPVLVIYEPSLLTLIPETPLVATATTLLPHPSVSTIPPILLQTTTPIPTPPITTKAPTITTVVSKFDAFIVVQLRVVKLEKDVLHRHTADLIQKYFVKPAPKPSKIQTPTIDLKPDSEKSASEVHNIKKEQAEKQKMPKNPANHALHHALIESLIEDENAMDKGVVDTVKHHKIHHDDDDEDPFAGPNQGKKIKRRRTKESESSMKPSITKETSRGKAPTKSSKTGKSATAHVPIKEPIAEVVMDNLENLKYPLTFDELMATPIDFSNVSVKKLHGYGHLDEIVVRRVDRQLYKFKEGDFIDLHLNDIEDMLLLAVQHKLLQLEGSAIVDLIMALRMFIRSLIIKLRVKDLQLGVIYENLNKQKKVMRADELYKFLDGTLKTVRNELYHRILNFFLEFNKEMSMRKWTVINKRRSELMVELIDKQMR
nr:hypothetical protein [Tanacetum cinerariifolium]